MQRRAFLTGFGALGVMRPEVTWAVVKGALPPEGFELDYRVFFGDSKIGSQRVLIRSHDKADHVVVEHEVSLKVKILFAVAYSLEHRSTELWNGLELQSIKSDTTENGDRYTIAGEARNEGFVIRSRDEELLAPRNLVTVDSFWLASSLTTPVIMNTRTGEIAKPEVRSLGPDSWHVKAEFPHGLTEVTLQFDGDFLLTAEIDSDGHTVKFERQDA
jgi:hypothetical protein